eukprot:1136200-Pelagomonas_calceolata.AAC.2
MVGASPVGVLRASLASGLKFWVDGRTLACVGVWIECKGKAVLVLCLGRFKIYQMCCARTWRACCRPRPASGCLWEATSGDLMPGVSCGGRLWCWYCLYWVVIAGLRVSINVGGGIECFIEVGINEATNVGVDKSAVNRKDSGFGITAKEDSSDNNGVKLFSGWKVDEGCQSIECHLTLGVHPGIFCLKLSNCGDHGLQGDVRSCIPLIPRPMRGCIIHMMRLERLQGGGVELTEVDTDQLTGPHTVVESSSYMEICSFTFVEEVHGQ